MLDLIIIGAGVAGLTAAIYSARAGIDFVVLEQDGWGGGQITSAHIVENYPALPSVSGVDLGDKIKAQAESLGAKIELGTVVSIKDNGDYKIVLLDDNTTLESRAIIIATGANPKTLGAENEDKFLGLGVSYCAVCDGAFYKGKDVFVIGGGDTAVEDAIYLADICKSVTLVHRHSEFRAPKTRIDALKSKSNVKLILNATLSAITGEDRVYGIDINEECGIMHYNTDGVFIAVGIVPATAMLDDLDIELDDGYIKADETCKTNIKGIYAAGDIRKKQLRQVVTSVSDGANAATSVSQFLRDY